MLDFLAGAQGLEPWAYGFGDEADKSASGGNYFWSEYFNNPKANRRRIHKIQSKTKQIGNFRNKPTVF